MKLLTYFCFAPISRKAIFALLFLTLVVSCGNSEEQAAESAAEQAETAAAKTAYETMNEGHDRIMPMMGQITGAQRDITEQLNQGGHGEEYRELLLAANEQLEDADDAMMEWMNKMRPLSELRTEMDHDEVMEFIREHTREIADVETMIKTSLATSEEVLGSEHTHEGEVDHDHDH